jgi:tetratricopeptide (TPR) repeat protein
MTYLQHVRVFSTQWIPIIIFGIYLLYIPAAIAQETKKGLVDEMLAEAEQFKKENPSKSKELFLKALKKAHELKQYEQEGKANLAIGAYYLDNRLLDSANFYFHEALSVLPSGDKLAADGYVGLGTIGYYKNDLTLAMENFIKALRVFESIHDDAGRARVLNNLGAISDRQENFQQAFVYYQQSYEIKEQQQDSAGMARSLNNLGSCSIPLKRYEEAVKYLLISISIKLAMKEPRGLANSYANLGIAYKEMGEYEKAIEYHYKNLNEDRNFGQRGDLFFGYNNLANVYLRQQRFGRAKEMADSALFYAKAAGDISNLMEVYGTLYLVAEQQGLKANAFDYFKNYVLYKDSLMNLEKTEAIEDLRTRYETERKEQVIKELEQLNKIKDLEANTSRQWRLGLIIFLGLSFILVAVLFNRYQLKQRAAKNLDEKNKELNELNGLKDRLFAVISHDLKSPLSAFNSLTTSLSLNLEKIEKEELAAYIKELDNSSKEVYSMLNNLLEWSISF